MVIIDPRSKIRLPSLSTRTEAIKDEKTCMTPRIIVEWSAERPTPEIWKEEIFDF